MQLALLSWLSDDQEPSLQLYGIESLSFQEVLAYLHIQGSKYV